MWSWWMWIQLGKRSRSVFFSCREYFHCFLNWLYRYPSYSWNKYSLGRIFSNSDLIVLWIYQILNQFQVNLYERHLNIISKFSRIFSLSFKNLLQSSWNHPTLFFRSVITNHSMRFSSSSLPISKYCSIKTLKNRVNNRFCACFINILLDWIRSKYSIISELSFISFLFNSYWSCISV